MPIGRRNSSHQRATFPGAMQLRPVLQGGSSVAVSRGCVEGSESRFECGASTWFVGRSDDRTGGDILSEKAGRSGVVRRRQGVVCGLQSAVEEE
jgi:hypothetical protein